MQTYDKEKAREKFLIENPDFHVKRDYRDVSEAVSYWRRMNPEKNKAHRMVFIAKRNGSLNEEPCKVCGDTDVEAHHEDYSKPLCVTWLCHVHHAKADKERRLREQ